MFKKAIFYSILSLVFCLASANPVFAQLKKGASRSNTNRSETRTESKTETTEASDKSDQSGGNSASPTASYDPLSSDDFKMTISDYEMDASQYLRQFVDAKGNLYIIRERIIGSFAKTSLTKFDPQLKMIFDKEFEFPEIKGKDFELARVQFFNGKPTFFYKILDKKTGKGQIATLTMDEEGSFNTPQQLGNFDKGGFSECDLRVSDDQSKLLLFAQMDATEDKLPVVLKVFDNQLKEIWQTETALKLEEPSLRKDLKSPNSTLQHKRLRMIIDNDGRVFALAPFGIKVPINNLMQDGLMVYQFEQNRPDPKTYRLDFNKGICFGFDIMPSRINKNELLCYGAYNHIPNLKEDKSSGTIGTFQCRIDLKKEEVRPVVFQKFSQEIFDFMGLDAADVKKNKGVDNLRLEKAYETDSSHLILIFQQAINDQYQRQSTMHAQMVYRGNSNLAPITNTSVLNTGIVVKQGVDGRIIYQKHIPKKERTTDNFDGNMGLITLMRGEKLVLLHNTKSRTKPDEYRNESEVSAAGLSWGSLVWHFGADNALTINPLFVDEKTHYRLYPAQPIFQNSPKSAVITVAFTRGLSAKMKLA